MELKGAHACFILCNCMYLNNFMLACFLLLLTKNLLPQERLPVERRIDGGGGSVRTQPGDVFPPLIIQKMLCPAPLTPTLDDYHTSEITGIAAWRPSNGGAVVEINGDKT